MGNFLQRFHTDDAELKQQVRTMMPSILVEQLSAMLLGMVNLMVMGRVSTAAQAGVGQINTFNNMVVYFFNAFAMGGTVMVAQNIGARNREGARHGAAQSLSLGLVVSVAVTVLLFFVREPVLNMLFGSSAPEVMGYSMDYFLYSLPATPMWFIYFQCAGVMRGAGDSKTPMKVCICMNVVNIALSYLLAVVLGLEAKGAGIAMLCSVAVGAVLSLLAMSRPAAAVRFPSLKNFAPDLKAMASIALVGLPAAAENFMFNGGKVIVQVFVASMSTAMISAYSVTNSTANFVTLILLSYNVMVVTIVGQRAGTGDKERTRAGLDYIYHRAFFWSLLSALVAAVCATPLILAFSSDPQVVYIGTRLMWIDAVILPLWVPAFVLPSGFRGAKDVFFSLIFGSISMWVFRVYGSYVLSISLGLAAYGVYWGMGLDWLIRSIGFVWRFKSGKWTARIQPPPAAAAAAEAVQPASAE